MRYEVQQIILNQPELRNYLRQHPTWYRTLSRDPKAVEQMKKDVNQFYGRTFSNRVERLQGNLQMVSLLMQMFQGNNEQ